MRVLLVLVISLYLCPRGVRAADFDHAGFARQAVENHIRPGYERLLGAAKELEQTVQSYCSAPPGGALKPVRDAFTETLLSWSHIEHVRFGPIMKQERHARMVYWPDRKGLGRKQVARALRKRDKSVLTRESLQDKSVALQGFGALEYILYAKGSAQFAKAGAGRSHRCGFMQAVAANIAHISEEVVQQWSADGKYTKIFLHSGPDNPAYLEPQEVTLEIAKAFLVGMERLRDVRIAGPLGLQRKSARRKNAAFERSGFSTRTITANLEGLIDLYGKGGLRERIDLHEPGMGKATMNDLSQSLDLLRSISVPMKKAVDDPATEDKLMAIGFPLKNAREQTARVLALAAGLSLGFNALDGD